MAAIPTLNEMSENVTAAVVSGAINGLSPDLSKAIAHAATLQPCEFVDGDDALINFIVYARACHEAGRTCTSIGRDSNADLFHALAQDMLDKAVSLMADTMAFSAHFMGPKH